MLEMGGRSHPDAECPCISLHELGKLAQCLQNQMEIKPLLKQPAFRLSQSFVDFPSLGSKLLPSFSPSLLELSQAPGLQACAGLILRELCCLVDFRDTR